MAKEVYSTVRIKIGSNEYIEPGEKFDVKILSKEELKEFYDRGFIEVREVPDPEPVKGPDTKVEEPKKNAK